MPIIKVEGFHGTALENVDEIMSNGFEPKVRDDHWLGQGIYFYSDLDLAVWWIKTKIGSKDGSQCAVVKSNMECEQDNWLDLDTISGMEYFLNEVDSILSNTSHLVSLRFRPSRNADPKSRIKNLCFALDLLKNLRGIKLVAMTFRKDNPSYAPKSISSFENRFFNLPSNFAYRERQICSTSNDIIASKSVIFPN
ncbi:MAG: hypothetical protein ACOYPR_18280 [Saprospiraceae bacterium]